MQRAGREMAVVGLSALVGRREPLTSGSAWFKYWFFHVLTEGSWMSGYTPLGLSVSICEIGIGKQAVTYRVSALCWWVSRSFTFSSPPTPPHDSADRVAGSWQNYREETEAQRGEGACPVWHSLGVEAPGWGPALGPCSAPRGTGLSC